MTNDPPATELRIRPATAEDVDAVAALYEELHDAEWHGDPPFRIARPAWRAEVSSVLESPGIHLLVAEAGGVVGTVRVELGERPQGAGSVGLRPGGDRAARRRPRGGEGGRLQRTPALPA